MARRKIENCGILVKFDGFVVQDGAFELFLHCMLLIIKLSKLLGGGGGQNDMFPPPPPPQ